MGTSTPGAVRLFERRAAIQARQQPSSSPRGEQEADMPSRIPIQVTVNQQHHEALVEPRRLLADFLRDDLELTGTHVGCEHGVCGACTVLLDGQTVRSCLLFAVQADGHEVMTVEGLAAPDGMLHPIQSAFMSEHGLQCGFCTPGFLMTTYELLQATPSPSDSEIREAIGGNLCRCTGYQNIVRSVRVAAQALSTTEAAPTSGGTPW
jgi:aerobic carbon-monoxide dehydrogenase small subunit